MITLRDKGRGILPMNLLIRAYAYETMRTWTVLPLNQIKSVKRETKIHRMVCIPNNTGEDYGLRLNPEYSCRVST